MKNRVVIFGTGSFAEVARFYLTHDSHWAVVGFTVHESRLSQGEAFGLPVTPFEDVEERFPPDDFAMYVAVGYSKVNRVRAEIYAAAKAKGYELITYVSSRCTRWGEVPMGDNCFVFEDNTIQPFAAIGNDVVMWSGNHIGHHASIGDHCFITSHVVVSGHVQVGAYSFLGVNSTIRDNVRIGQSNIIGAGALILSSTADGEVYPAARTKPHRLKSDEARF